MRPKTKGKVRKRKGAAPTPQPSRNTNKAPQAQVTVEQSLADEEVSFWEQGDEKHQLDQMMGLISALSDRVNAAEAQKTSRDKSPLVSPTTWTTLTTARPGFEASHPQQVAIICKHLSGGKRPRD